MMLSIMLTPEDTVCARKHSASAQLENRSSGSMGQEKKIHDGQKIHKTIVFLLILGEKPKFARAISRAPDVQCFNIKFSGFMILK